MAQVCAAVLGGLAVTGTGRQQHENVGRKPHNTPGNSLLPPKNLGWPVHCPVLSDPVQSPRKWCQETWNESTPSTTEGLELLLRASSWFAF